MNGKAQLSWVLLTVAAAAGLWFSVFAGDDLTLGNEPTGTEAAAPVPIWPGKAPGETKELPPEKDQTTPSGNLVAGRRVIRLGNVSTPTVTLYRPPADKATGAAIVICPGGGHHILALDLEGTEVAEWLNSIGVTAVLLKYRVPARESEIRWRAAVQDAQRAVSLTRSKAKAWGVDPDRIGILGFSAGGETAGLTAVFEDRKTYDSVDAVDESSCRPDFAVLVYPAWFIDKKTGELRDYIKVSKTTPPMFFAHAYDDRVSPLNSVQLFTALKKNDVPAELHIYSQGGHGYGLRETEDPVTSWARRCAEWLKVSGWLAPRS